MASKIVTKKILLDDGREITLETGKLARQAHGSIVLRCGKTMLLATVVSAKEAREGADFLPLSVDYQEKFAAVGRIPGGFLKREGKLSDNEVLVCRLIDRAIRPLFPSDYHCDTQVMISLVSGDEKESHPDVLAALAVSAALIISDIPFTEPISEVRVGRVDGQHIINPTPAQLEESDFEITVAATRDNILMLEGEMKEISEEEMMEAMKVAHEEVKKHCAAQLEMAEELGVVKREHAAPKEDEALKATLREALYDKFYEVTKQCIADKHLRSATFDQVKKDYVEALPEDHEVDMNLLSRYVNKLKKEAVRNYVLDERKRLDGRALDEIRQINSEVDFLPSAHGSALFTRGETQSLTSVTLGTKMDSKMIDGAIISGYDKFYLHYNFPGFSTGEVKPNRGASRREIGHGNLAHRALKGMLPEDMPYTVRVVSDILESNGSSSMATVCAGTLGLMDAGIQMKAPVSGIAMGLISDPETGRYAVLSDILGDEDHLGDMDFKVTGTENGMTACQMDIKVDGLSYEVLSEALAQARRGREHILGEMKKAIAEPRQDLKPHAPRFFVINIPKDMIGAVIGPGGKIIQEIQAESDTTITIEEDDNQGIVSIFGQNAEAIEKAKARVNAIVAVPEVGEVYDAKVKSIMPYGAFVEFMPGKEGLLHVSEIKWERVEDVSKVLEEGEEIKVKLLDVDSRTGKFKLSRKALLPKPQGQGQPRK